MLKEFATRNLFTFEPYLSTQRQLDQAKVSFSPILITTPARFAITGLPMFFKVKRPKIRYVLVRLKDDVPSPASVPAIRTACRHIFLAEEAHASIPTVACL
jgi:hypothetical protein